MNLSSHQTSFLSKVTGIFISFRVAQLGKFWENGSFPLTVRPQPARIFGHRTQSHIGRKEGVVGDADVWRARLVSVSYGDEDSKGTGPNCIVGFFLLLCFRYKYVLDIFMMIFLQQLIWCVYLQNSFSCMGNHQGAHWWHHEFASIFQFKVSAMVGELCLCNLPNGSPCSFNMVLHVFSCSVEMSLTVMTM